MTTLFNLLWDILVILCAIAILGCAALGILTIAGV